MSVVAIHKALLIKLDALTPALATAFENDGYSPVSGTPYQEVNILTAQPENPSYGAAFHRQRGYLQVKLKYPQDAGNGTCLTRAQLLREWFPRGLSLVQDGVTVIIEETPEIGSGSTEGDRYVINVFVRFFANIGA